MKTVVTDQAVLFSNGDVATSRDGYTFHPTAAHWHISRDIVLGLRWIDDFLDEPARTGAVNTLLHYAQTYSAAHTRNMSDRLRSLCAFSFQEKQRLPKISPTLLINYRASLDQTNEYYLGGLSGFLTKWVDLGFEGIDPEVAPLLNGWRLKGNIKGLAVQMKCPHKGALSDLEAWVGGPLYGHCTACSRARDSTNLLRRRVTLE